MKNPEKRHEDKPHFDILIIGGGINGAGIAREASQRGYSVCLCDSGDFGGGTSSASTKLIHGGLRYLEHYEFRLVREALIEREVLWKMAPHIIWPMRFILPHHADLRPAWILRFGLFLYDHLGGRKLLPPTKTLDLKTNKVGSTLKPEYTKAFEYSDCWVEDSRLVVLNLQSARQMGADIRPRTPVKKAAFKNNCWQVELQDKKTRSIQTVSASTIINAAGPWVDEVLRKVFGVNQAQNVRLVRGSHIVVAKKFEHDKAYIFQNDDERIIFAIPYEGDFTLIGTTDTEHADMAQKPQITDQETNYLCDMASEYFREPVNAEDIIWTYSGVRPLYDDGASKAQEATRDYVIEPEKSVGQGSLINIFGGKITTFRKLAKSMMSEIEKQLPKSGDASTEKNHFSGGDFPVDGFEVLVSQIQSEFPFLEPSAAKRLVRNYGTDTRTILNGCSSSKCLGKNFGCGLYQVEVEYLVENEWAQSAEDILYRRTKLGLHMNSKQINALEKWMA